MKIALVSPYDFSYPGGVTEHTAALANGLQQRGHEIHILAACSGYQGNNFPHIRTVAHKIAAIPIAGTVARVGLSPLSYIRIKKILQQESYEIIHLQEPLTPSITWWFLLLAPSLPQTAMIGTFHAYHEQPNWFYKQGRPLFGKLFARLDNLIAVSEAAYHFAHQMFPGNYQIIANGVDLKRFGRETELVSPEKVEPNRAVTILFVGRLDKRKGFANLFEAFIALKPAYPELKLQVVGPFEAPACQPYKKTARAHGVTDIEFVGYVSPERLPYFYHKADIFCAPSLGFESFGIVLLEAMAAGLPIIASDIAGYRSVITQGQEGFLTPPGQPAEISRALQLLISQPDLRQKMGKSGRLKANQFNWDSIVDKTLELYLETIQYKLSAQSKLAAYPKPGPGSDFYTQRRHASHVKRSSPQI
jgi:phosphatidylinositol alpha-mannosyltransferase